MIRGCCTVIGQVALGLEIFSDSPTWSYVHVRHSTLCGLNQVYRDRNRGSKRRLTPARIMAIMV